MLIDYSGLTTHWQNCNSVGSLPSLVLPLKWKQAWGIQPLLLHTGLWWFLKKKKKKRLRGTQAFLGILILQREVKSFCCLFFLKLQREDTTVIVDPVSFRDGSADSSVWNSG